MIGIHHFFERQAELFPYNTALIYQDDSINYESLNHKANQLAHFLSQRGLKSQELVAIALEPSIEWTIALLAVLKSGGAFLPLDSELPQRRIDQMLDIAKPKVLIYSKQDDNTYDHSGINLVLEEILLELEDYNSNNPSKELTSKHLAYVIFTSGSTGVPKGVMIEHGSILNHMQWMIQEFSMSSKDRFLQRTSVSFDASIWEFFAPLMVGGTLILAPKNSRSSLEALTDLIAAERITILQLVPSLLQVILTIVPANHWPELRIVFCGGEKLTSSLCKQFYQLLSANLVNLYGPTEATIDATYYCVSNKQYSEIPIGKPIANLQTYVLNDGLDEIPPKEPGQLYLKGIALARGYINDKHHTNKQFIKHPSLGRIYATGDYVKRYKDGTLIYLGRIDHQVKINGQRLELEEIDSVLQSHTDVQQAVTIYYSSSQPSQLWSFLRTTGTNEKPRDLEKFVHDYLPRYARPVQYVIIDAIPLTLIGKVDRKKLNELVTFEIRKKSYDQHDPTRGGFLGLVEKLIHCPVNSEDKLIQVGGNSLIAMQLQSRINKLYGQSPDIDVLLYSSLEDIQKLLSAVPKEAKHNVQTPIKAAPMSYPLSYQQMGVWLECQRDNSASNNYHEVVKIQLLNEIQFDDFQEFVKALFDRHKELRTSVHHENGEPSQRINNISLPLIQYYASSEWSDAERNEKEHEFVEIPFDLMKGPLIRFAWLAGKKDNDILVVMHHIISDQWSVDLLLRSFIDYQLSKGNSGGSNLKTIENISSTYGHYVNRQRQIINSKSGSAHLDFWSTYLKNLDVNLALPKIDSIRKSNEGNTITFDISSEVSNQLRELAQQYNVTSFMLFLSLFNALLHKYTAQDDIAIITPVSDRTNPDYESVFGFFINTVIIRSSLSENISFAELLLNTKNNVLEILNHAMVPYQKVLEVIQEKHGQKATSQVMFLLQDLSVSDIGEKNKIFKIKDHYPRTTKFDFTLFINEKEDCFTGGIEYSTELYSGATVVRFIDHFQNFLESVINQPDHALIKLPMISDEERKQLITDWNAHSFQAPRDKCIHQLFEQQALLVPDSTAVIYSDQSISYSELNKLANQLSHSLIAQGATTEVKVGICISRSIPMVTALLGILKAGGAYVALDPDYPSERLEFIIQDSGIKFLVVEKRFADLFNDHGIQLIIWEEIQLDAYPDDNPQVNVALNNLAYLVYTSGSTGKPKAVLIEHRAIPSIISERIEDFGLCSSDVVLQFMSLNFDASLWEIALALCSGAALCLGDKEDLMPGQTLIQVLNKHKVTCATFPPSVLMYLDPSEVLNLKLITVTGESCPPNLIRKWTHGRRFFNGYGPSETTIGATIGELKPDTKTVTIGKPFGNYQVYILDSKLNPVPIGIPGEIYIGGIGLARGYHNHPELTRSKFIESPFDSKERLFKTGDLARFQENGEIVFLGRLDRMVKIRGVRIELEEIEKVLNSIPQVQQSVVEVHTYAEGKQRLVGFVVPKKQETMDREFLLNFLSKQLPDHMIPTAFVFLAKFSTTPNGKIDRKALPMPDPDKIVTLGVLPSNDVEKKILISFRSCLKNDQIGVTDSFFDAGGQSLMIFQLIGSLTNDLGVKFKVRTIFDNPTVRQLADFYSRTQSSLGKGLNK